MSGIYLIKVGKVKDLKTTFIIESKYRVFDDEHCVYKFGKTKNFERRMNSHKANYCKDLHLEIFTSVDEKNLSVCEKKVRDKLIERKCHFIERSFSGENYKELVIIPPEKLEELEKFYKTDFMK